MATAGTASKPERILGLLKRPPLFNEQKQDYVFPFNSSRISATHGTSAEQIVNLAMCGQFKGGRKDHQYEFYTTPNLKFNGWFAHYLGKEVSDLAKEGVDAFEMGVGYAETSQINGVDQTDLDQALTLGAVVAFNKKLLEVSGLEVWTSDEHTPELVLPSAPSLETIHGIYPLNQESLAFIGDSIKRLTA